MQGFLWGLSSTSSNWAASKAEVMLKAGQTQLFFLLKTLSLPQAVKPPKGIS